MVPVRLRWQCIPLLTRWTVRFHVHGEESGHAVDAEAGCEERNTGREFSREIECEIRLTVVAHSEHSRGVDLHLQRDQIEFDCTAQLLVLAVV